MLRLLLGKLRSFFGFWRLHNSKSKNKKKQEYKCHESVDWFVTWWVPLILIGFLYLKVLDEYLKKFGDSWKTAKSDCTDPWPYLNDALTKYQVLLHSDLTILLWNSVQLFYHVMFRFSSYVALFYLMMLSSNRCNYLVESLSFLS